MWRDQDHRLSIAFDDTPGEFRHRVDRVLHVRDRLPTNLRHHDWWMRCNAGKDEAALGSHSAFRDLRERSYSSAFAPLREPLMMLPMHYDLLIVGAGPAGSFAAELLARGGAKVALF